MIRRFRALAALAALALAAAPALAEPAQVKVESGALAGVQANGVAIFRAVPYAAPPVGRLRWAPPARPLAWAGARAADKAGPSCPQPMNADGSPNLGAANGPMSEDCLQLNVFAPTGVHKAPVMVWLHGGAFRYGAGWVYDGSQFARDGVVVVAINYRLGPLGYFAHPALIKAARPGEAVGNYGLMDQIAALQWVKRNIKAFGGDPANVTVAGESAGAMSALALLSTPSTKGLYRRAIVESGGGWSPPMSLAAKAEEGARAIQSLGLPAEVTVDQLRALPVETLIARLGGGYGPFSDGRLLPRTPAQAFAAGKVHDVPLIIGSNSGEDSLMGEFGSDPKALAAALSPPLRALYADEAAQGEDTLGRVVFGDQVMGAPARWIAARAAGGQPAWLYHFSYIGSRFRPRFTRAFHAAEIQYVFEYWGRRTPMSLVSDEDKAMAGLMHSCWVAFIKTGTPACASGPAWPAYAPASDQLMEFGNGNGVRSQFHKARLDAQEAQVLPTLALPVK
ncbi:carboxylesterase/lipase family protein [Phenylobacterium aquaticum]|uniref:carboxylesterase/lipase family protein n=1 Tax=Phenylobacterium aquaticum TaxID=1763816 RepID=UPI0026F0F552|nr:carboxylesterase family protein [Phenylobacterium aquaticum]